MIESIEKLREWSHWLDCAYATSDGLSYQVHSAPLSNGMKSCGLLMREKCDEIEVEIAERYMELPVGKDGKPLRFGETVYGEDGRRWVVRSYKPAPYSVRVSAAGNEMDKRRVKAVWMTHEKPRTIEDVLESFIEDYDHWDEFAHFERGESRNALFAKYADEIRKAVGE